MQGALSTPLREQALRSGARQLIAPYRSGAPMHCRSALRACLPLLRLSPWRGSGTGFLTLAALVLALVRLSPAMQIGRNAATRSPPVVVTITAAHSSRRESPPDCRRITAVPSGTRKPLELIRALRMSRVEHSRRLVQVISLVVQISGQPYHLAQELTPITGVSFAQRPQRTITNPARQRARSIALSANAQRLKLVRVLRQVHAPRALIRPQCQPARGTGFTGLAGAVLSESSTIPSMMILESSGRSGFFLCGGTYVGTTRLESRGAVVPVTCAER